MNFNFEMDLKSLWSNMNTPEWHSSVAPALRSAPLRWRCVRGRRWRQSSLNPHPRRRRRQRNDSDEFVFVSLLARARRVLVHAALFAPADAVRVQGVRAPPVRRRHAHRHCRLLLSAVLGAVRVAPGARARLSLSPLRSLSALRCAAAAHSGTHNHNHNHYLYHNLYDHHFLS
jgi:hypothetical protein